MAYEGPVREPVDATQREVTTVDPEDVGYTAAPVTPRADHRMNVAERFIWLVAGLIMGLLALRFLLRLLGANPSNGFADFIYNLSYPFAAPFFGLFSYTEDLASGRFEFETLVAIVVYALIAWLLARIVTLGKR